MRAMFAAQVMQLHQQVVARGSELFRGGWAMACTPAQGTYAPAQGGLAPEQDASPVQGGNYGFATQWENKFCADLVKIAKRRAKSKCNSYWDFGEFNETNRSSLYPRLPSKNCARFIQTCSRSDTCCRSDLIKVQFSMCV